MSLEHLTCGLGTHWVRSVCEPPSLFSLLRALFCTQNNNTTHLTGLFGNRIRKDLINCEELDQRLQRGQAHKCVSFG